MPARLALAVLVLVAGIVLLRLLSSDRANGTSAPRPEAEAVAAAAAAEIVHPPAVIEPERGAPAEPGRREEAPAAAEPSAMAPESPPTGRQRLRGILLHSSDRRPAAGAALVLHQGEEFVEAVTDADGRFATEAVLTSGPVRVWHKGDVPEPVLREHLEVRPETVFLPEPTGSEPEPFELVLVDPPAWVEVQVVTVNGQPAPAELRWLVRPREGPGSMMRSPTDESGHARLPLMRVEPGAKMLLVARAEPLVSEIVTVEAPPDGAPVRLVLDAGGTVRARVLETSGEPRPGARLSLEDPQAGHRLLDLVATTDADGVGVFSGVAPGRQRVVFWYEALSESVRSEVAVERGLVSEVELRVPSLPVAVAGHVLDPDGRPVSGVSVGARIGERANTAGTNQQGAFAISMKERGSVRVAVEPDELDDRYEPAVLEVPFGTTDVVFRQLEVRPITALALEILEHGTHARIPEAMVLGFIEPEHSSWTFHRAREGLVTLELKLYDDVAFSIEAVGYRRKLVRAAELAAATPPGEPCRVVLEAGLERWLQVLDEEDDTPLVGARVLEGEREVALTDGDGRAAIELGHWPAELQVLAAGHQPGTWTCREWLSELGDGVVWLERAPADGEAR